MSSEWTQRELVQPCCILRGIKNAVISILLNLGGFIDFIVAWVSCKCINLGLQGVTLRQN